MSGWPYAGMTADEAYEADLLDEQIRNGEIAEEWDR